MTPRLRGHAVTAIDVHAHYLDGSLPDAGAGAPRLTIDLSGSGRIMRGGTALRPVPSVLWDVGERLDAMDRAGLSHQVISPVPAVMEHAWLADPSYARAANDAIADACDASDGRLIGLGCLPASDFDQELSRLRRLGLRGIEFGSRMAGSDLDAPGLDALWRACAADGACVFVHPVDGGRGVVRPSGQQLDTGLGMITDTGIAASAVVLGGVLSRHPTLRLAFAHGCGTFPWAYPRLRDVRQREGHPEPALRAWDAACRRLYADTLVGDAEHVRLVAQRLGADRLVLGSDMPFWYDDLGDALRAVEDAVETGAISTRTRRAVLVDNALALLGLDLE